MKLIHRFAYYLGGLSIGVIIVFFFFGGRYTSCAYFPNARVLKEIRMMGQKYSPEAINFFTTNHIDTVVVSKFLRQGEVIFDKSQTDREQPCRTYVINGIHQKKHIQIDVKICKSDSLAIISKAHFFMPKE